MGALTVDITLKNKRGSHQLSGEKVRFSAHCCFAHDGGIEDLQCMETLGHQLNQRNGELALYGTGRFFTELLSAVPQLKSKIRCVITDDGDTAVTEVEGLPVVSPSALPESIDTVFLCETLTLPRWRMKKRLPDSVTVLDPDLLVDLDDSVIPARAWVPFVDCIYPIDVPEIEFKPNQDMLLIDCPSRNLSFMPNGLGYVHNALKKTSIDFQTLDLDIIVYHRFHIYRLFDTPGRVVTASGREMPEDPWAVEEYDIWQNPDTLEFFQKDIDEIIQKIVAAKPKILGLSIQACNINFSKRVAQGVKKALPDTIILVGGFSCYQASVGLRAFPDCDYMTIGEADLTVGDLVEKLARGERPTGLPGVLSRFDPPDMTFIPGPMPEDLDAIDQPEYEWYDLSVYRNFNHYQLTPVIASRGCRWSLCTFCAERFYWRIRSPKSVVDELEWLADRGCDLFMFNESDFNGKPEIVMAICDEIIRRGLKVRLTGQLRIHRENTREFFDKLRAAGFVTLRFGVDAWARRTLKLQVKGYTPARITQNLRDCTAAGIFNEVNTVIGVPGETEEDIDETIDLIIQNKENIGRIANINPLLFVIGSVYWEEPDKFNVKFRADREELYRKYSTVIPSHLWYSTDPYIDEHVRKDRFIRVVKTLDQNGFNIGDLAKQVIKDVEEGRGAEAHARPDDWEDEVIAEKEANQKDKPSPAWPEAMKDDQFVYVKSEEAAAPPPQENTCIFKYNGVHYRILLEDGMELPGDTWIKNVRKGGAVTSAKGTVGNLARKFFGDRQRFLHYFKRGTQILKSRGVSGFLEQFRVHVQQAKGTERFILATGEDVEIKRNLGEDVQLVYEGVRGYNIIRVLGDVFAIKQGHPFHLEWYENGQYEEGVCINAKSVREAERLIDQHLAQETRQVAPQPATQQLLCEGFHGYNLVQVGDRVFGVKQGYPLYPDKVNTEFYPEGTLFEAGNQGEIESVISAYLTEERV
ncbi:hypothetical protein, putative Cobalamin-binding Fe-S oxidoreductase [Nitrospina gracilis 3/211]|uniref:Uncharacterized protein n=1 Tax=Nitrospina gracilis (strain 3/211) TaxID=1266370 RepID=M1YVW9_NITG3|nr:MULTISPECIES: radical SAM protein [Nitrospina]MCF8722818.1 radical SAM superfamily enzyme YgiQ (UPF0313 family) [Nitrospina sp. Nb-3]CCQ89775.1 hypothetical protein, putative Cobalamin-binding Fe-S oxidoreductase [Nitrospina gracilis 3/211]